jgi:hypothetical protein
MNGARASCPCLDGLEARPTVLLLKGELIPTKLRS